MMNYLVNRFGKIAFWLTWPLLFLYLKNSKRSRVLLAAGGKVLLVKTWHGPGTWSLPGGGIGKHEDPIAAATRELMEETNIALGVDQLKPLLHEPYKSLGLKFDCYYFVAELDKPIKAVPKLPEILAAEWVAENDLSGYKLSADARAALSSRSALLQ